jgi:hypothetical protein
MRAKPSSYALVGIDAIPVDVIVDSQQVSPGMLSLSSLDLQSFRMTEHKDEGCK